MDEITKNWESIKQLVQEKYGLSDTSYEVWIKPLTIARIVDDEILIPCVDIIQITYLNKKYLDCINTIIREYGKGNYRVKFVLYSELDEKKRSKVILFIGPTGAGKTTTIAKYGHALKVNHGHKIIFVSADDYKIGAKEQMGIYATILDAPLRVYHSSISDDEKTTLLADAENCYVIVDTASYQDNSQWDEYFKKLYDLFRDYDREILLVLPLSAREDFLEHIVDHVTKDYDFSIVFSKLDEVDCKKSAIYNLCKRSGKEIKYVTTGGNVPEDIECFDIEKFLKQ